MQSKKLISRNEAGFSLLEVMITITILMGLVMGVSNLLRTSIDMRQGLSENARVNHRLSSAMQRISWDIEHAFVVGINDTNRGGSERRYKTIFRIEKQSESDKLSMTVVGNQPNRPNANESDSAYVVYELREAKDVPGRKHLYRGVAPMIQESFSQDPQMRIFVRNIKTFKISGWRGDDWATDRWDTTRSDTRDKLPKMVRIEIEAWADDPQSASDVSGESSTVQTVAVKTVVMIQQARLSKDVRQPLSTARWY
jgi:type II secretory pathway component PulJ